MKVLHLNHTDSGGGAARAAYRLHRCLLEFGIESQMWVDIAQSGDWTVCSPSSKLEKVLRPIRAQVGWQARRILTTANPILHSPALLSSRWLRRINSSDADIVHLHWVQAEMLSISDIGRIEKPIVWTLHDMWAFCGAEHYTEDARWKTGYRKDNRPPHEAGFDLNRWTWQRKKKHWRNRMHIVAPSQWLGRCVSESALMRDFPVSVVPNPLDTGSWRPIDQRVARQTMQLPQDAPLLLFGAIGGQSDRRKGFDLLLAALEQLPGRVENMQIVILGQMPPREPVKISFPVHYTGHLYDDVSLRLLYSAVDAMAIPSRQDNLPNTAVEAQACGTPVIAFNTGGLPDIVQHGQTGYLADAFDPQSLAAGIERVLRESRQSRIMSQNSLATAARKFAPEIVARQYREVYEAALSY